MCYHKNKLLTINQLLQLMLDPQTSWRERIASERVIPGRAHQGQQSEGMTLRSTGPARLVWIPVVTSIKVSLKQHQERPHQHCLQHLHWQITQCCLQQQHHLDFSSVSIVSYRFNTSQFVHISCFFHNSNICASHLVHNLTH